MIKIEGRFPGEKERKPAKYAGKCEKCGVRFTCIQTDLSSSFGSWTMDGYSVVAYCRCPECGKERRVEETWGLFEWSIFSFWVFVFVALAVFGICAITWDIR